MSITAPARPADALGASTAGRRNAVLAAMSLGVILVVAAVSMLNVALPDITRSLSASSTEQLWIVDAYTLALASLLLPFGALGDRYGRRGALVAGIVLFGVASFGSAFVTSVPLLIALRALSGVAAALIMPATLSTITNVFPAAQRARAVGVWAGCAGAGGVLGILASGWLLEHFWWGSVFVLVGVLAVLALAATLLAVPASRDAEHPRIDVIGALLSMAAIGGIVFGIIEGPHEGWRSAITATGVVGGVLAGVAWVLWSLRAEHPLLDPRLFRLRGFATGSAMLLLQFFALFGLFLVALQYLLLVLGYGTFKAAIALLPIVAVLMPISIVAASLAERVGQRWVAGVGALVVAAGMVVFATTSVDDGYVHFLVALLICGVGVGLSATPATNAIVASLPAAKQGVASAMNDTAREVGAALGIAVLGTTFNTAFHDRIAGVAATLPADLAHVVQQGPAYAYAVAGRLGASGAPLVHATHDAFVSGMRAAMIVAAATMVAGAIFTFVRAPRSASADLAEELASVEREAELI